MMQSSKYTISLQTLLFNIVKCCLLIQIPLYYTQYSTIGKIFGTIYLLVCSFFMFKTALLRDKDSYIKFVYLFIFIFLVYCVLSKDYLPQFITKVGILYQILLTQFTIFPFYYMSLTNRLNLFATKRFVVLLFISIIIAFFLNKTYALTLVVTDSDSVTNNTGYLFAAILPIILLFINKRYLLVVMFVTSILFAFMAIKRGAILVIMSQLFFFVLFYLKKSKHIFRDLLVTIIFVSVLIFVGYEIILSNDFIFSRIERTLDGDSSGRDVIYVMSYNYWVNKGNIFNYLFGYGMTSSFDATGNYAHSDWLELLLTMGLLGVIILLMMQIVLSRTAIKIEKTDIRLPMILVTVYIVVTSIFSMVYANIASLPIMLTLGICLGLNKSNIYKYNVHNNVR